MHSAHPILETAIGEVVRLRSVLKKKKTRQVTADEECQLIKATSLSWFNSHAPKLVEIDPGELAPTNNLFRELIGNTAYATARTKYDSLLKALKQELTSFQTRVVSGGVKKVSVADEKIPSFVGLINDPGIRAVLISRWDECTKCVKAQAPLSATVMMGGLLEALLLARVNREADKSRVFSSAHAPKDRSTGKALPLKDWTLRNYIEVAHDLLWISQSVKDIGEVLRDYRNYVHPYKEISHGVKLTPADAVLFWEITKSIALQLIAEAGSSTKVQ